jgi:amino acid transporter
MFYVQTEDAANMSTGEKKTGVFLRDATGLVRELGTIDALIFAIGAIVGPFWVVGFNSEWFLFPGVSIPASIILISFLALANGLYYVLITAAFPRSGGGSYVPLSRTIHPALGMAMTFIFCAGMVLNMGFIANITLSVGLAGPLSTYATLTNNPGLQSLSTILSTPSWIFIIGSVFIILVGLIAAAGNRAIVLANKIAFIVGTVGILIMIAILATTSNAQFQTALNNFAGSNVYQNITEAAAKNGMVMTSNWTNPTLLSLPVSFFIILGYAFNTYYSGEIRRVTSSMTIAMVGSIIFTGGFFALIAYLMENTFGYNFIVGASYLINAAPSAYPLSVPPWVNVFVALLNSNPIVNILIMANFVAWGYFLIINFIFIPSRHFLAYSFDGAFPARLGGVSDRFHSPIAAIAVCVIIGIAALGFLTYFPTVAGAVNVTYMFIIGLTLDGLGGIALVARKKNKNLYELCPPLAKKKVAGIPLIAILGAYSVIFVGALLALAIFYPYIIGPLGAVTEVTSSAAVILALISYFGMKAYNRGKGLDISIAFREIPPE